MKIACIAYLHGFGGAERQITTLANQLVKKNNEVHLIIIAEDKRFYEIDSRIHIHSLLEAEKGHTIFRILNRRKLLLRKLKDLKCDVIINFNLQSAYLLALSNKKGIGKILYSERTNPGDQKYKGFLGLLRWMSKHRIDAYVFQTKGAQEYFNDTYIIKNSTVIPNACFYKKDSSYAYKREKRIVSVGRLSEQKNQKILIEAFSILSKKHPDYILELYGEGELQSKLEHLSKKLGIENKVVFKGTTSDIRTSISNASLFVLSSNYEGIPNALIEAMASGLPCISTDCKPGGARALITSGYDGLITPIEEVASLASAMEYMINNPKESERMALNATKIVDRLAPEKIYDMWERYLENIVESN